MKLHPTILKANGNRATRPGGRHNQGAGFG